MTLLCFDRARAAAAAAARLIGRGALAPLLRARVAVLLSNRPAGSTTLLQGRTLGARFRSEAARAPFLNAGNKKKTSSLSRSLIRSLSLSLSLAHLPRPRRSLSKKTKKNLPAVPQDHHHQEEARARREAEQADPAVDPLPHGQQDQVQRQAPPLEAHQARVLEEKERERGRRRREDGCFFCARLSFPLPLLLFPPRAFLLTSV